MFTYELPFEESKIVKGLILNLKRKNEEELVKLVEKAKLSIETNGYSAYDIRGKKRSDALATYIKLHVTPINVNKLEKNVEWKELLRKNIDELIPSNVGFDVKEVNYVIDLMEELPDGREVEGKKFVELEYIDSGSYADVHKYYDEYYDKYFVVKKAKENLNEKEIERFEKEFKVMKKISSPYVVEVFTYNENDKSYTMELMDTTLWKYLQKNKKNFPLKDRFNLAHSILSGFFQLRDTGYLHRDISPNNILLKQYDKIIIPKISDFGLVKAKGSELTSINSRLRGSLNDHQNLKMIGFKNYNEKHETYALTQLIVIIITCEYEYSKIKNNHLKNFLEKGLSIVENRYQNLEELKEALFKLNKLMLAE